MTLTSYLRLKGMPQHWVLAEAQRMWLNPLRERRGWWPDSLRLLPAEKSPVAGQRVLKKKHVSVSSEVFVDAR